MTSCKNLEYLRPSDFAEAVIVQGLAFSDCALWSAWFCRDSDPAGWTLPYSLPESLQRCPVFVAVNASRFLGLAHTALLNMRESRNIGTNSGLVVNVLHQFEAAVLTARLWSVNN